MGSNTKKVVLDTQDKTQKVVSDTPKMVSDTQKVGSDTQKVGSDTPKILTTGRWICRKCLSYVPLEAKVCRCGCEVFSLEFDMNALSEALGEDAERARKQLQQKR